MGNLYLVDRPMASSGLALAADDEDAVVVLVQDGVYADISGLRQQGRAVYAVKRDLERRGLCEHLADGVEPVEFGALVDLIVQHKVVNFA
ncbi:MAG: hypothetical protein KGJ86_01055 [Chloroflexota bacterium]|nr:hypothetical protein [Chloroflexota bacterium]